MNTDTTSFLTNNVLREIYSVEYRRHTNTINATRGDKPSGNKNINKLVECIIFKLGVSISNVRGIYLLV